VRRSLASFAVGYSTIALNHVVQSKFDPKVHSSKRLDEFLRGLKERDGVVILKRLTIVLDEASEKGFGLTTQYQPHFAGYDILALAPTTPTTFSQACLTHTVPSPLTTHIISLPTDLPRQLRLKHTLVKTALRNGAMFEICYSGALGVDEGMRRNWWGCARETVRACAGRDGGKRKGGVIVNWGGEDIGTMRAPRDVANLVTLLGLVQDQALNTVSKNAKSTVLRSQTRKTYRAILSEPRIVYPSVSGTVAAEAEAAGATSSGAGPSALPSAAPSGSAPSNRPPPPPGTENDDQTPAPAPITSTEETQESLAVQQPGQPATPISAKQNEIPSSSVPPPAAGEGGEGGDSPSKSLKRARPPSPEPEVGSAHGQQPKKKKKKKGGKGGNQSQSQKKAS